MTPTDALAAGGGVLDVTAACPAVSTTRSPKLYPAMFYHLRHQRSGSGIDVMPMVVAIDRLSCWRKAGCTQGPSVRTRQLECNGRQAEAVHSTHAGSRQDVDDLEACPGLPSSTNQSHCTSSPARTRLEHRLTRITHDSSVARLE